MTDQYKTDREIMLQAGSRVSGLIESLRSDTDISSEALIATLKSVEADIQVVTTKSINYQIVVDNLDENILIADSEECVLYVNPAYVRNSGFSRDELLGRKVTELLESGKYFTQAVVPEVIRSKERVMKLSSLPTGDKPGVIVGVPVFDSEGAIEYVIASNRGLSSYIELHDNFQSFITTLQSVYDKEKAPVKVYENSGIMDNDQDMIGSSPEMQSILRFVRNVSDTDASVLITGESGTGKELVANAIYKTGKRASKPFVKVNCSSIPASLIESELFGYEKGAFSGASAQGKKGLFEAANGGTILLDEIGDMPLDAQAKLLRVLQNNEVTRVGGVKPIRLDVRLIASTNCNLKEKIRAGEFRSDLYYRLHIIPIKVPPLRDRRDDIPLLCRHYLDMFSKRYSRSVSLSDENMDFLCSYNWPGNIRELRNIMEYLVVCCSDLPQIDRSILAGILDYDEPYPAERKENMTLSEAVAECESRLLEQTMKEAGSMKEAARILGVDISTISRKMKQYGLSAKAGS